MCCYALAVIAGSEVIAALTALVLYVLAVRSMPDWMRGPYS